MDVKPKRRDPRFEALAAEIVEVLQERSGLTAEDIAACTGYTYDHIRGVMLRLYLRGMVDRKEDPRAFHHGKTPFRYSLPGGEADAGTAASKAAGD